MTVHLHKDSEKIRIKRGVRQGDTISPKLFTATLESIFRRLNWENKGVKIHGEFVSNLRFADDISLCTEIPQELQHMLQELSDESRRMGLKMHIAKTTVMVVDNTPIHVNNVLIENVQGYVYLGQPEHVDDERPVKVAWHNVNDETIDRYKRRIDEMIPNMIMSSDTLLCNNVLCECGNHRSDIDDVFKQLIDVVLRAGRETLPQCNHKDRGIPYWNDEVESVRETAMFWHWLWVDSVIPRYGHVAAIMRKTRASYHYAVRHIKRRERELRKRKMAESVSTNKQRDIWVETQKMLSGKKPSINSVDGACNPEAISEVFASKYETLFQGTPTDHVVLQSLYRTIKSGVTSDEQSYSSVNVNDVLDALKDIKLGKHDGKYSLTSDHVVNSSRRFLVILSILMSSMHVHGYNAADL